MKKAIHYIFVTIFIILFFAVVLHNMRNNPNFWDASVTNCATIAIAVFVSYFLVQRQNNRRKQKDIILELILKLQVQISNPEAYHLAGQSSDQIMMRKRDFSNKINILDKHKSDFGIKNDIDFVVNRFQEYEDLISNHINDLQYLSNSSKELQRPLSLIENKLYDIALFLYK